MAGITGVDTARALRLLDPEVQLAFLTTSPDFALEAIGLEALHYLVKPVTGQMLDELFRRFFKRSARPSRFLQLPVRRETRSFPPEKIRQIISREKGIALLLDSTGEIWLPCPFHLAKERLQGEAEFVLISRGCVINMNYLRCIDYDVCVMTDGTALPLSRRERSRVRRRYNDFLFDKLDRSGGIL